MAGIELATAYVSIVPDTKKLSAAIKGDVIPEIEKSTGRAAKGFDKMTSAASRMGSAIAAAGVGMFLQDSIKAASDLSETMSKTSVIFGENVTAIEEYGKAAAQSIGMSKREAMDAASTFATFGKAAGLAGSDLTEFSTGATTLAADLGSFWNTSADEAITAIGAAMRGETEPIRRFGVMLDDASMRNEALKMGLIKTTNDALTPQQKSLAAYSLIMKQTTDAQGDFARTQDGLAGSTKKTQAALEDAKAQLGEKFIPVALEATTALNGMLDAFNTLSPEAQSASIKVAGVGTAALVAGPYISSATTAVGAFGTALTGMTGAAGVAAGGVSALALAVSGFVGYELGSLLTKIPVVNEQLTAFGENLDYWFGKSYKVDVRTGAAEASASRVEQAWKDALQALKDFRNLAKQPIPKSGSDGGGFSGGGGSGGGGGGGGGSASGDIVSGPSSGYPWTLHGTEAVISFDSRFRDRNLGLVAEAAKRLGMASQGGGGTTVNVTGLEMNPDTIRMAVNQALRSAVSAGAYI